MNRLILIIAFIAILPNLIFAQKCPEAQKYIDKGNEAQNWTAQQRAENKCSNGWIDIATFENDN